MQQVGRSEYTKIKQMHFEYFLEVHFKIAKAIISRKKASPFFFYADIFAGDGGKESSDGSPVIFEKVNAEHELKCKPLFIEENPVTVSRLKKKISSSVINASNEKILPQVTPHHGQIGLMYVDPNGDPPFELIEEFYSKPNTNRIDLLIYFSGTTIKRALKCPSTKRDITLADNISRLPKKHWLIRSTFGKFQWSFLFGTNWVNFPTFNKIGFHNIRSEKGQYFLNKVNHTAEELKQLNVTEPLRQLKQLRLFDEVTA